MDRRWPWALVVAAAAFALAVGLPVSDPDVWWHLASGRWMVEHASVLRVDVFSSTVTGQAYDLGEWLGELALYAAYAAASWAGLVVLRAALVAVAAFAVTRSALRAAPPAVAVPLAAAALILSKPVWTDRPELFTLALVPVALDLLLAARHGSRAALVAIVPLVVVWSDLHAGYAVGFGLLWLFAIDAALERRDAGAFALAAVAATTLVVADPGALPLTQVFGHIAGGTHGIVEESPIDVLTPFGTLFALFVGATFASFLLGGGSLLGGIVLVPMLWLALTAQRHVPLFGLVAVPFLAGPFALASRLRFFPVTRPGQVWHVTVPASTSARRTPPSPRRRPRFLPELLAAATWLAALASIAAIPTAPDVSAYPAGALPALRASSGVLLNEYDWGGYLIWNAPDRPVFIDGRLTPYVADGVLAQYRAAMAVLPGWHTTLERWNVRQALLRPGRALAEALREDGWTVLSRGPTYVLLERPE